MIWCITHALAGEQRWRKVSWRAPAPLRAVKLSAGAPRRPVHEIVRVGQDETVTLIIHQIILEASHRTWTDIQGGTSPEAAEWACRGVESLRGKNLEGFLYFVRSV